MSALMPPFVSRVGFNRTDCEGLYSGGTEDVVDGVMNPVLLQLSPALQPPTHGRLALS